MNLFLLGAPYQVINALEGIHHFGFVDNVLWVMETGHFTRAQFESVIDPAVWHSVRYHDFRYKLRHLDFGKNPARTLEERCLEAYLSVDQFRKRRRADRLARRMGPVDALVLGNYRRDYDKHMRHLANRLRHERIYLLDVGTDTLRNARDRESDHAGEPALVQTRPRGTLSRWKQRLKRRLLDWDTRGAPSITFFSTYDLVPSGEDRVVRNEYAYLKSVVAGSVPGDKVFFVGQPLVDQGYISLETFRTSLARIQAYFAGQRLTYVVHPRESEAQLSVVRDLSVEIERFTAPFEYAVAFSGERPRCIASFFSSVVENVATIFGGTLEVKSFRLPESLLLKDREGVAGVYRQFGKNVRARVDVVDIRIP